MGIVSSLYVERAFAVIRRDGIPTTNGPSIKWDVIDKNTGERFPPKAVLATAKALAGDTSRSGGGGWPTNNVLEELGFQILPRPGHAFQIQEAELAKLPMALLAKIAKRHATPSPARSERLTTYIERSAAVSALAKRLADGTCDLCTQPAPFSTTLGPYLECHHVVWLSRGGADTIDNVTALCANCHRKMHLVGAASDVRTLKAIAQRRAKELS